MLPRHARFLALGAVILTVALVATPDSAYAQEGWRYLPLWEGNSWTYHQSHPLMRFAPVTGAVDRSLGRGIYHLDDQALPLAGNAQWVGFGGDTLYAWSFQQRRWVRFVDFGADAGASWTADLDGVDPLQITVRSRTARVESPALGRTIGDCVVLDVRRGNATETEQWTFAPNVGLIAWRVPVRGFDLVGALASGEVWRRQIGPIGFTTVDAGLQSRAFPTRDSDVRVFNSTSAFERFWQEHAPGTAAPRVDFSSKSVLVALAGGRFGPREVRIERVTWNFPWTSARVRVVERDAPNVASAATTWPFAVVVLDGKVRSVTTDWQMD